VATEAIIYQQIVDMNWDQAIHTASPNNTINVAQFAAKGSGTNIGIALTPKGTGYISAQVPDGTTVGGNARGTNAVDLQFSRAAATHVATGTRSALLATSSSRAAGTNSACIATENSAATGVNSLVLASPASVASGQYAIACAGGTASGDYSFASGLSCTASAIYSRAVGVFCTATEDGTLATGRFAKAHRFGMRAHAASQFGVVTGSSQAFEQTIGAKTSNATPTEMGLNNAGTLIRFNILADTVVDAVVSVCGVKSDGSAVARYQRQVTIKRVGSTTSLVGSVITLGTDEAAGTALAITADDTNDSLKIEVTGIAAETWRWSGLINGTEMIIGT